MGSLSLSLFLISPSGYKGNKATLQLSAEFSPVPLTVPEGGLYSGLYVDNKRVNALLHIVPPLFI